jgi:hypothetical protein
MEEIKIKKQLFIILIFLGISQLGAETLLQIYPPSFFGFISGKNNKYNGLEKNENDAIDFITVYNFPIEIRQTIAKSSIADLMIVGGLSFSSDALLLLVNSVSFSAGLSFGYGYYEIKPFFRTANITLYPLYEYPFLFAESPIYKWKFAMDISWELLQLKHNTSNFEQSKNAPLNISLYIREIGIYEKNYVWFGLPDVGLIVGLLLF